MRAIPFSISDNLKKFIANPFSSFVSTLTVVGSVGALVAPTEIHTGNSSAATSNDTALRIAIGGAGQSGLVKALADAFINESIANGSESFTIGLVLSDTTFTIKNLQSGEADLGISYVPQAEQLAAQQGIISAQTGYYYFFRDHFIIAGPSENPTGVNDSMSATTIFAKIYQAGELNTAKTPVPTRFLTRYDKSATNPKESTLWLGIGQVPWALPYSTWYHQFPAFPIQALSTVSLLKEYTLTDRGTFLSLKALSSNLTDALQQLKVGTDDENDPLLLPGHLLVGNKARNAMLVQQFAKRATSARGQKVVTGFQKNGTQLYSGAP
ncbi:hypothetical protein E8E11_010834 [Didymella keratinophila]|nr:hypothetical protein E8E11_010834 [Didymella keratinophila]